VVPIVTPEEMRAIDAAATTAVETLIERAGSAVAWAALRMLGGAYGRRVVVVAGKGNNGNDGRAAARKLGARGVAVGVVEAHDAPTDLPECDLVIDAAFGTGFRGTWVAPDPGNAQVLAVDIPSGVDGLTGQARQGVMSADHTVTFAALKPGLLFPPGAELAGSVEVADIGLDCSRVRCHLVQQSDVAEWYRPREFDAHKWQAAVRIIAGSAGMTGAAHLAASSAQRSGAGMVHLSVPGAFTTEGLHEYVQRPLAETGWGIDVLGSLDRFHSLVIGPGLGRDDATVASMRDVLRQSPIATVVDGDGLFALAWSNDGAGPILHDRRAPTVLTPHEGEFALLAGAKPGADRIEATRQLAAKLGVVVLLKGPATVVADRNGDVLVVTAGDDRLATAGTGDVLSGIIGALIASGTAPFEAAAAGAWIHGQAARLGHRRGFIASDLLPLIPQVLDTLT
jgi:ADP-dependent NAD(P)H-hydrate dehydratase / NAD(P)H-hydrate epimerase